VIDYFLSYRALVRAKVASLVACDTTLSQTQRGHAMESVRSHLDLGLAYLEEKGPGRLILACGSIGSGKTTVAEALADETGGVVISSDLVRRTDAAAALAANTATKAVVSGRATSGGRADAGRAPYTGGRYSDASRSAVYARLLEEARHVVLSGRTAILDATFSRRAWRDEAAAWAALHARSLALVEVAAPKEVVLERLAARAAAGNDASEAGPGLYDAMRAEFEDPAEWPAATRARIDTSSADWREQVASAAREFAA
jgi:hypothetical protein